MAAIPLRPPWSAKPRATGPQKRPKPQNIRAPSRQYPIAILDRERPKSWPHEIRTARECARVNESSQLFVLLILALPIASIAWTITHEEVVREFRDLCLAKSAT